MEAVKARILVLGSYHMANPGRDVVKIKVADTLGSKKQAEILEVIDALERFQPTKVAVEEDPAYETELQKRYLTYRAGTLALDPGETEQLGFRIAARLGHPRLYPINEWGRNLPFPQALEEAKGQDPAFVAWFEQATAAKEQEENNFQDTMTVRNILRRYADPAHLANDHAVYLAFAPIGAGGSFIGAEVISAWYDRNIRIFARLHRLAEPGDRILVVYGVGHAAILRELVRGAEDLELTDPLDYL